MCKGSNVLSWLVLIGRGLDLKPSLCWLLKKEFALYTIFRELDKNDKEFPGGDSKEATPVPIPNTVVKLFHAFGTSVAGPRESR